MNEQYAEYRSRRKDGRETKKGGYARRFGTQLVISLMCLSAVFLLGRTNSELSGAVNSRIKSALDYKIDTQKITAALDGLIFRYRGNENQDQGSKENTNAQSSSEALQDI